MPRRDEARCRVRGIEFHDQGAETRMTLTDGPYPAGGEHADAGWALAALVSVGG